MLVTPLGDKIIVRRDPEKTKTDGGLVIPDAAREKATFGTILAVGPGRTLEDGRIITMTLRVDQRVLFSRYAGTELKVKGQDCLIMIEDEVMGVVEEA